MSEVKMGRYTICGDGGCFTLSVVVQIKNSRLTKEENVGKDREVLLGHFRDIQQCIERLVREELCDDEIDSLDKLLNKMEGLAAAIAAAPVAKYIEKAKTEE